MKKRRFILRKKTYEQIFKNVEGWTEFGLIGVEWYNVHHHSFRRDGDVLKLKGSVDLSLILEERDSFEWTLSTFLLKWVIKEGKSADTTTRVGELKKRRNRCDEQFVKTRLKYRNGFLGSASFSSLSIFWEKPHKPVASPKSGISSFRCEPARIESLRTLPAVADCDFRCLWRQRRQFKV